MTNPTDATTEPTTDEGRPMRASDADRHRVERVLQDALGAGMLTLDETEERLAAVHSARYRHELPILTADLQVESGADGPSPRPGWFTLALAMLLQVGTAARGRVLALSRRQQVVAALVVLAGMVVALLLVSSGLEVLFSEDHGPGREG